MKTILAALWLMGYYHLASCSVGSDDPVEIKWVWANSKKATQNLEPAGYEGPGITSYLCRAHVVDHQGILMWVPGKQIGGYCFVHHDQPQANFQVPDIPLSTTSWIPLPLSGRRIPSKVVIGGNHWDGTNAYICRGYLWSVDTGYVVPGTYSPNEHVCYIPFNGEELRWGLDAELLAINAYGVSLGLLGDRVEKPKLTV